MSILVINAGSSSVKYQLFDMAQHQVLASGLVDRIGESESLHRHQWLDADQNQQRSEFEGHIHDHHQALAQAITQLTQKGTLDSLNNLTAIGHRVVHGGEAFKQPALITEAVITAIRSMIPLAPLHNPANLEGIEVCRILCPAVPQVAVFDTAFHQTMPAHAFHYAVPDHLYRDHQVRRYGFHGTSHHYVAKQAAEFLDTELNQLNLITLHLGNGCSAAAIQSGQCIDTSMGMTPLEGLMMGTRCGDIDPALHFYLMREGQFTTDQLEKLLNKESGLKGICGSSDMREVAEKAQQGDELAQLARSMFAYRVKKVIGSYYAVLGQVDAIIFTGGIGENDVELRLQICAGLEGLGIELDQPCASGDSTIQALQSIDSRVKVLVIPTNEELEIALCAQDLISHQKT
ncbi:acetate/propionate family kinase [Sedimenticola selenatireducens]|uniref:Acetate kinase n=1 Tax=Sedimenticola selenatireducens TaxID=191960 RepID=A0A557SK64_9GAMM|nr:acetate kinase [Sedimenticola selenatireducens]TVO77763.1 acetate kinase [Sedimenticola selenatireducens]TVT65068.1 MAG: acetate kinase [Sedimenticola selenatireducens]